MSARFTASRDDHSRKVVITIELDDHDLARRHLVPVDVTKPADAIAGYVLHCLQVLDETRRLEADRRFRMLVGEPTTPITKQEN